MLNRSRHLLTHWMMVFLILMGPWLSLWTTPYWVKTAQGEQIFLCTLQGIKAVNIADIAGDQLRLSDSQQSSCPALQLLAMLGQSINPPALPARYFAPQPDIQVAISIPVAEPPRIISSYTARAPPFI